MAHSWGEYVIQDGHECRHFTKVAVAREPLGIEGSSFVYRALVLFDIKCAGMACLVLEQFSHFYTTSHLDQVSVGHLKIVNLRHQKPGT